MGAPITWRNVNASPIGEISRTFSEANKSFNAGFGNFTDILKKQESTDSANWDQVAKNNTNAYLEELNSARTPEELAAKEAILASMRQGAGAQINSDVVRQATDNRLPLLQQRALQQNQYEETQKANEWRPTIERLTMMANSEDADLRKSAKEALGLYIGVGMPGAGKLSGEFRTTDRQNTQWDQADTTHELNVRKSNNELALHPLRQQEMEARIALTRAQTEETANDRTKKERTAEQANLTKLFETAKATNPYGMGVYGDSQGTKAFLDFADKQKLDGKDRTDIGNAVERIQKKLGNVPLPVSVLMEAVQLSSNGYIENRGEEVERRVLEKMGSNIEQYTSQYKEMDKLTRDYQSALAGESRLSPSSAQEAPSGNAPVPAVLQPSIPAAPVASRPTGSWSVQRPVGTQGIYANAGPESLPATGLPLQGPIQEAALAGAKVIDVLRGQQNYAALGKPFDSTAQKLAERFRKAEEAAKKAKGS